jgi:hypothetical protein
MGELAAENGRPGGEETLPVGHLETVAEVRARFIVGFKPGEPPGTTVGDPMIPGPACSFRIPV